MYVAITACKKEDHAKYVDSNYNYIEATSITTRLDATFPAKSGEKDRPVIQEHQRIKSNEKCMKVFLKYERNKTNPPIGEAESFVTYKRYGIKFDQKTTCFIREQESLVLRLVFGCNDGYSKCCLALSQLANYATRDMTVPDRAYYELGQSVTPLEIALHQRACRLKDPFSCLWVAIAKRRKNTKKDRKKIADWCENGHYFACNTLFDAFSNHSSRSIFALCRYGPVDYCALHASELQFDKLTKKHRNFLRYLTKICQNDNWCANVLLTKKNYKAAFNLRYLYVKRGIKASRPMEVIEFCSQGTIEGIRVRGNYKKICEKAKSQVWVKDIFHFREQTCANALTRIIRESLKRLEYIPASAIQAFNNYRLIDNDAVHIYTPRKFCKKHEWLDIMD